VIVIDGSYYIFHRYYATSRWCSLQNPPCEFTADQCLRHLENDFRKFRRQHEYATGTIWIARDCPRDDIWRKELFPEYKGTRTHNASFDYSIIQTVYDHLEREKDRLQLRIVRHPRLEADDICYILQRHLSYARMIIIANDNDFLQLCNDRVDIINKEGRHIKERGCGCPTRDLLRKILLGDKSDNIPSICRKLGPKTADKLLCMTSDELDAWIDSKGGRECYELNRKLIDMSCVPIEYVNEVCAEEKLTPS
jgi:5'-3' exonuclease